MFTENLKHGTIRRDGEDFAGTRDFNFEAYTERFGIAPDNFAAAGYAQMKVVASVLKSVGPDATREQVRDAFNKVKDVQVVLGTGNYSIGENRTVEYTPVLLNVTEGNFVGVQQ